MMYFLSKSGAFVKLIKISSDTKQETTILQPKSYIL